MRLYLEVTRDRYELPVAVADSVTELARRRHVNTSTVSRSLSRGKKSDRRHKYISVEIEDGEASDE